MESRLDALRWDIERASEGNIDRERRSTQNNSEALW
jgi:hypothetical protein